jgi:hypothetical protein
LIESFKSASRWEDAMITMKNVLCLMAVGLIATLSVPAEAKLAANKLAANKLAANKLAANKLAANRLAANRLAANRLAANGTATAGAGAVLNVVSVTLRDGTVLKR